VAFSTGQEIPLKILYIFGNYEKKRRFDETFDKFGEIEAFSLNFPQSQFYFFLTVF